MDHLKELREILNALDEYFWLGETMRPKLDGLLEKHGFDLSKPIGVLDIVSGFAKKYNLNISYNEGNLRIEIKSTNGKLIGMTFK